MSTPLIAGIALTGQPKDFANVAARRQAESAKPKVDKELDAYNKEVQKVLKVNENAHPGLRTELEDVNTEGLGMSMRMVSQGDYVGANSSLRDISNRNAATMAASKAMYDLERIATQGGYNLPDGFSEFLRSDEFSRARGADKVMVFEEFMSRPENLPYRGAINFRYDERGRPVFSADMGPLKKQDAGRTYSQALEKIRGQAQLDMEEFGRVAQQKGFRVGTAPFQQEVRRLAEETLIAKFDELALRDSSFLFNAALSFPGLKSDNPDEVNQAKMQFISQNEPMWAKEFRGATRSAGGGSRSPVAPTDAAEVIKMNVAGYGDVPISAVTSPIVTRGTVSINADNAFEAGETDQFNRLAKKEGSSKLNIKITSASILPVYTGENETFEFNDPSKPAGSKPIVIKLEKGMPIPLEYLVQIEEQLRKSGTEIPYRFEAFFLGETGDKERAGGKTTFYRATPANRNAVGEGSRNNNLMGANWAQELFPDNYQLLNQRGVLGGKGGGSSSPAPAPQRTTPAPAQKQQEQRSAPPATQPAQGQGSSRITPKAEEAKSRLPKFN